METGYGDASACLKLRIPLTRRGSGEGDIKLRAREKRPENGHKCGERDEPS